MNKIKRYFNYRVAFLLFVTVYVFAFFSGSQAICNAGATGSPVDYCFVTKVTVTNSGTSDLGTDEVFGTAEPYPVRVTFPATSLINSGQMDERGWDLFAVNGSYSNEISVTQQSLTSTQAPYWFWFFDFTAGESRTVDVFTGNNQFRTDGSIRFSGVEELETSIYTNDVDITNNLKIEMLASHLYPWGTSGDLSTILEYEDDSGTDLGFRIFIQGNSFFPFTATWGIRFNDSVSCTSTLIDAPTPKKIAFEYVAAAGFDTFIYVDDVVVTQCDLDQGPLYTNHDDEKIVIGGVSYGEPLTRFELFDLAIYDTGVAQGRWSFAPSTMNETSSVLPYTGTVESQAGASGGSFMHLNYSFNRDQSDLSFSVEPTQDSLFLIGAETDSANNEIFSGLAPSGFETARTPVTTGVIYDLLITPLNDVAAATGVPANGVIAGVFYAVGLILGVIVFKLTDGHMPLAVTAMGIGPALAVVLGQVPEWWLLIWGMTVAVVWFAQLRSQQES